MSMPFKVVRKARGTEVRNVYDADALLQEIEKAARREARMARGFAQAEWEARRKAQWESAAHFMESRWIHRGKFTMYMNIRRAARLQSTGVNL